MHKKDKNKKVLYIYLLYVLCCILIISGYISHNVRISFEAKSNESHKVAVFWDSLEGEYPFDEQHYKEFFLENAEGNITLTIPKKSIKNIRIDLGTEESQWEIKNLVIDGIIRKWEFTEKELVNYVGYINEATIKGISEEALSIEVKGTDGFITFSDLDEHTYYINVYAFLSIFLICIAPIVLYLVYRVLKYMVRKIIDGHRMVWLGDREGSKSILQYIKVISILILDTVLLTLIWDRWILVGIGKLVSQTEFTLARYFRGIENFSLARVAFWFIWIFIFLLCIYLGFYKSFKYRYGLACIVFIYLVAGQFHGNSIGFLAGMLDDYTEEYEETRLLGVNQGLRGDDWAVWIPLKIAQVNAGTNLSYYNPNLMLDGYDGMVGGRVPVNDIMGITRTKNWGYYILPIENAIAFEWWLPLFMVFLSSVDLIYLLTKNKKLGVVYGLLILYAPPIQWWNSLIPVVYNGQYFLVMLGRFLKEKEKIKKVGLTILASIFAVGYIFELYPALQVPFAYIFLIIGVWLFMRNKDNKPFQRFNIISYLSVAVICVFFIVHFFQMSGAAMETQLNTVYPGKERAWVTVPYNMSLLQIINFFMSTAFYSDFLNNCEISQFFGYGIWTLLVCICLWFGKKKIFKERIYKERGNIGLLTALVIANICLIYYIYGPQIPFLYKIMLLTYTYPRRAYLVMGYCSTLILIFVLQVVLNEKIVQKKWAKLIVLFIGFISFIICFNDKVILQYIGKNQILPILAALFLCVWLWIGYSILSGQYIRQGIIAMLIINILSSIWVNPISRGIDAWSESKLIQKVMELNTDKDARWMVSGDPTIANMINACGVKRVSGTYYYPDISMNKILDPNNEHENLLNRYNHISMDFGENNTFMTKDGVSTFITIDADTAQALNVKFLVSNKEYTEEQMKAADIHLNKLFTSNKWHIYSVNYTEMRE